MASCLLLAMASWLAASPTLRRADLQQRRPWDFHAAYIPVAPEIVFSQDIYLLCISMNNTHSAAITVTVSDRQASPLPILGPLSIAAGQTIEVNYSGRLASGGVTWVASVDAKVVGYMRGLQ